MSDPTPNCTPEQMQACIEQHQTMNATIMGKLATLTLAQKTKLTELIDIWIAKLQP